jgi:hypothetical protein
LWSCDQEDCVSPGGRQRSGFKPGLERSNVSSRGLSSSKATAPRWSNRGQGRRNVGPGDFKGLRKLADACSGDFELGIVLYGGAGIVPFGEHLFAAPVAYFWVQMSDGLPSH